MRHASMHCILCCLATHLMTKRLLSCKFATMSRCEAYRVDVVAELTCVEMFREVTTGEGHRHGHGHGHRRGHGMGWMRMTARCATPPPRRAMPIKHNMVSHPAVHAVLHEYIRIRERCHEISSLVQPLSHILHECTCA